MMGVSRLIDKVLGVLSPAWEAARTKARLAARLGEHRLRILGDTERRLKLLEREGRRLGYLSSFDAAKKTRVEADWSSGNKSADTAIVPDYPTLLARARAAERDDWAAASIIDGHQRHAVATGIKPRCNARDLESNEVMLDFASSTDWLFRRWAQKPIFCDQERRKTFAQMQALVDRELNVAGGAFALLNYQPRPDMVGLTIQLIEPEQLDTARYKSEDGQREVRYGIEIDEFGAAVAFWLYLKGHPLDTSYRTWKSTRVPAERMLHVMRQERVRQTHGVPRLHAILRDLWHLKMYEEYTLHRARMEACMGAAIERDINADPTQFKGLLTGDADDEADANANPQWNFEPGMLWDLPAGRKVTFNNPQTPGGQHEPYIRRKIIQAAAGAGLDYPTVSRDFAGNTYAGQRQGLLETWAETDAETLLLIDLFVRPVWEAFVTYAILEGRLKAPRFNESDDWKAAHLDVICQPPAKAWIDPANQAAAAKIALEQRLTSLKDVATEQGMDWRELLQDIAEVEKAAAELGIYLPSSESQKQAPGEPRPGKSPNGTNSRHRGSSLLAFALQEK